MPIISLIAALANNRVIGNQGQLPWRQKADLQYFKAQTLNKPIIMGRTTFETLPAALPKRRNIIITRQTDYQADKAEVFTDLNAAIAACSEVPEIMIVGGAQIYQLALPIADRMYLTFIDAQPEGDTLFPQWDVNQWQLISEDIHPADADNQYAYNFSVLEKLS